MDALLWEESPIVFNGSYLSGVYRNATSVTEHPLGTSYNILSYWLNWDFPVSLEKD